MKKLKLFFCVLLVMVAGTNVYLANSRSVPESSLKIVDVEAEGGPFGEPLVRYLLETFGAYGIEKGLDYLFSSNDNTHGEPDGSQTHATGIEDGIEYAYTFQKYKCVSGGNHHVCDIPSSWKVVVSQIPVTWP